MRLLQRKEFAVHSYQSKNGIVNGRGIGRMNMSLSISRAIASVTNPTLAVKLLNAITPFNLSFSNKRRMKKNEVWHVLPSFAARKVITRISSCEQNLQSVHQFG